MSHRVKLYPPVAYNNPTEFFGTPHSFCMTALEMVLPLIPLHGRVLDVGAGRGAWGIALKQLRPDVSITGVEIQNISTPPKEYAVWRVGDFMNYYSDKPFDFIMSNPPFKRATDMILKARELVKPNGYLYFLQRLLFLESQDRFKRLWSLRELQRVYVCSNRIQFEGFSSQMDAHAMFLFQKGAVATPQLSFFVWDKEK